VAEGAAAAHDNDLAAVLDAVTAALRARGAIEPARRGSSPPGDHLRPRTDGPAGDAADRRRSAHRG
jgi:hypothetical protein